MRPRYLILHCPAYQWFVLDRVSRAIVTTGLETREAAEDYIAALAPAPERETWTVVRDDEGVPVRIEG